MFFADQPVTEGHLHNLVAELLGDIPAIKTRTKVREVAVIETRLVGRHVEKPTKQQVERDPFAPCALGAHVSRLMSTIAFKRRSGGMLGRPLALYAAANLRLIDESASSAICA